MQRESEVFFLCGLSCLNKKSTQKMNFITWYPSCRRSDTLANYFGGTSHLIHHLKFKRPLYAPLKYLLQSAGTWRRLFQDKPGIVFVASPPVIAVLAVWIYCRLLRRNYVVDAHTGVFDDHRWTWLLPMSRALSRGASVTIVTNEYLKRVVEEWGARAVIIGDLPVEFPREGQIDLGNGPHVAVINTFSQDEPLDEVLQAASQLSEVKFHITGDIQHARTCLTQSVADNVNFTGWLSEEDYAALLRAGDVVVCLTKHDHTMQRGAYEAMSLGKPLVTSNWPLLRDTFCRGTIHVDNSAAAIASAVRRALTENAAMSIEMQELVKERMAIFRRRLQELQTTIGFSVDAT